MDRKFMNLVIGHLKFSGENTVDNLDTHAELKGLGLDSMGSVRLLIEIEDAYGLAIPDDQLADNAFYSAASLWEELVRLGLPVEEQAPKP